MIVTIAHYNISYVEDKQISQRITTPVLHKKNNTVLSNKKKKKNQK